MNCAVSLDPPHGMIDIHAHVLPGIDDGPETMSESLDLLRCASEQVGTVIATPHVWDFGSTQQLERIEEVFKQLQDRVVASGIDIELLLGAELPPSRELSEEMRRHPSLTLNGGGRYVLLEFPVHEIPMFAEEVVFELATSGMKTVLAHPERCISVQADAQTLTRFLEQGVLLQMNAGSILGRYGRRVAKTARKLLKADVIQIMASDAHGGNPATYALAEAVEHAGQIVGLERAREMVTTMPASILDGR